MSSLVGKWTFREILLGSLHTCHKPSVWAIVGLEQRVWKKLFLASEARQRCQHKLAWASSLHWDFPIKVKKYLHPSTSLDPQEAYISPTCFLSLFWYHSLLDIRALLWSLLSLMQVSQQSLFRFSESFSGKPAILGQFLPEIWKRGINIKEVRRDSGTTLKC